MVTIFAETTYNERHLVTELSKFSESGEADVRAPLPPVVGGYTLNPSQECGMCFLRVKSTDGEKSGQLGVQRYRLFVHKRRERET